MWDLEQQHDEVVGVTPEDEQLVLRYCRAPPQYRTEGCQLSVRVVSVTGAFILR